jgi:hypothetical protein
MPSKISISLATEEDAPAIASVMTAAFVTSDAAYSLIWGSAAEGTHDIIAKKGLFTPVQKEGRVTFKAVDEANGKLVGFATWDMPKEKQDESQTATKEGGLPPLPGVNLELWGEKVGGTRKFSGRDVDDEKDMCMFPFSILSKTRNDLNVDFNQSALLLLRTSGQSALWDRKYAFGMGKTER